uniref:Replication protein A C-terminal domain-containing protein n=1 Tax=Tetraselmis chuii TaxID=63592 RepID=A0A7S1X5A6_9CHLO|mmetsp:Transcript_29899/g.53528  ORF Transcript_29899/g.53528 Transcript_29899/m.53528 type:complete len:280 (+) Transcript_29899:131-970(+)|eukprot:CAMPEP_0177751780 /NCGR_PEP_ID=MMETSP0491_2-20121128/560_1 /TAXON_ID=63592 /ORGANISM="Tetraselmis chuii, Strain PLY429" /LENGTH=279 /DNA_ID=CAMNT_0019266923 /DNA_START=111 /DNA_END=950 /DNA_ORIENTATION=+
MAAMFDASAAQFGGGGFMASQADTGVAMGGPKKFGNQQTMKSVTIKQLAEATSQAMDDQYMLDGEELSNVSLVARIVEAQEAATCLSFKVDDGTGTLDVRYWVDNEESELMQQNKAQWRVDAHVRIHGNVRSFNGERQVVAYSIRPITDFNEVTFHYLHAIFQHEHTTRMNGANPAAPSPMGVKPQAAAVAAPFMAAPAAGGIDAIGDDGLNHAQRLCKQIFESPECANSEVGFTAGEVMGRLNGQLSAQQVKDAVEFLVMECHVYTTTDDDHFKSTNC